MEMPDLSLDLLEEGPEFDNELNHQDPENPDGHDDPNNPDNETQPTEDDEGFDLPEDDPHNPESVSEEDDNPQNDPSTKGGSSPNSYSSIAEAFVKDGVFSGDVITEEDIKKCKTAEDFEELAKKHVQSMLTDEQKRVADALNAGVQPDEVRYFTSMIDELNGITEEALTEEGEEGENLRKSIIVQEYLNRGYTKERALSIAEDSISKGLDVEDAKKYLQTNKDYFTDKYKKLQEDRSKEKQAQEESLKKAVFKTEKFFGDLEVPENVRQQVWDSIMKPIKTEDGKVVNKLQQYADEHPMEFRTNVGLVFVLTKGFTDLSGLVGKQVKKHTASALREIETKLTNGAGSRGGGMSFIANTGGDPEAHIGALRLDLRE